VAEEVRGSWPFLVVEVFDNVLGAKLSMGWLPQNARVAFFFLACSPPSPFLLCPSWFLRSGRWCPVSSAAGSSKLALLTINDHPRESNEIKRLARDPCTPCRGHSPPSFPIYLPLGWKKSYNLHRTRSCLKTERRLRSSYEYYGFAMYGWYINDPSDRIAPRR
jgi:hypothetical protein